MSDVIENNLSTGEIISRNYTQEEIIANQAAQLKQNEFINQKQVDPSVIASYKSTLDKLSSLGLTNNEIAVIMKVSTDVIENIQNTSSS
jgi:plasmid maintenance system antidote protein VapI